MFCLWSKIGSVDKLLKMFYVYTIFSPDIIDLTAILNDGKEYCFAKNEYFIVSFDTKVVRYLLVKLSKLALLIIIIIIILIMIIIIIVIIIIFI